MTINENKNDISREVAIQLLHFGEINTFHPEKLVISGLSEPSEGPLYYSALRGADAFADFMLRRYRKAITPQEADIAVGLEQEKSRVRDLRTLDQKLASIGITDKQLMASSVYFTYSGGRLYGPGTSSDVWENKHHLHLQRVEDAAGMSFADARRETTSATAVPDPAQARPQPRGLHDARM